MNWLLRSLALGSLHLLAQDVFAMTPDNAGRQYDIIAPRNIFNLKPVTKEVPPTNAPPPAQGLKLMGVTTMLGYKQAILKPQPSAGKPGQAAAGEHTLMLAEGQREGDVEVLQIDEKAGRVKVNNSGTIMTLDFEKDGVKQAPTLPVAPPNPAGAVANPPNAASNPAVPVVPTPTGMNPAPPAGVVYPGQKRIPSRFNPNGTTPAPVTLPGTTYPPANNAEAAFAPSL